MALVRTPRFRLASSTAPRRSGKSSPVRVPGVVVGVATRAILLLHDGCAQCASLPRTKILCFRGCSQAVMAVLRLVLPVVRSPMCRGTVPACRSWLCRHPSPRRLHLGCRDSSPAPQRRLWQSPVGLSWLHGVGHVPRLLGRHPRRRPGLGAGPCAEAFARLVEQVGRAVVEFQTPAPEQASSRRSCCGCPGSSWWAPCCRASSGPRAPSPAVLPSGSRRRRRASRIHVLLVGWLGLRQQQGGTIPARLLWLERSSW